MNKLYRYRAFNENTLRELIEGELWHSHVRNLNDPFEHPFDFDWSDITIENLPTINRHLKLITNENLIRHYFDDESKNIFFNGFKNWLRIQIDYLKINQERTFICCFSESENEPLMWSHYSNGMTGLCFIYNRDALANKKDLKLERVIYNESVSKMKYSDVEVINKKLNNSSHYSFTLGKFMTSNSAGSTLNNFNFLYQKHNRWKYEKEVRSILFPESNEENLKTGVIEKVGDNAVIGVIIGSKMNKVNRKIISTLCKERNIPIHIAIPNKNNYSVDIVYDVHDPINYML
ncbi:DUF2971 domain-containing protein [Photobacterium sp. GB-3]|uniref:DUF2971 domain-containing protein n=1 Tax=Photobacterium sp. GB-3 TaxID=2022110 RepID=UPI000D15D31D|nr:DUF2971 domain-containing protein [Photobacterium sp. GB-3]PSV56750.1 hypothetical protein C9J43_09930 [Photobacterium sp. GB-3]